MFIGILAAPFALVVLRRSAARLWTRHRFLRTAPREVQGRMERVRDSLEVGAGHLDVAEREIDAGIATEFWDAMEGFAAALEHCRAMWNEAVDIAERKCHVRP